MQCLHGEQVASLEVVKSSPRKIFPSKTLYIYSLFVAEWKLLPDVTANDSSSFVLERIKSMLKNLIGHVEYKGKSKFAFCAFSKLL